MSTQALFGQLLIGLINGSFYAMMSLGLAIIFGLLGVTNIAQGAFYMMGAVFSWLMLRELGIGYFYALLLSPILVGLIGAAVEKTLLSRIYKLDHMYGLLLTFGILMFTQGMFVYWLQTAEIWKERTMPRRAMSLGFLAVMSCPLKMMRPDVG